MKKVNLVEWSDILFHAERLGFFWNYAHELLRVFQDYDGSIDIYCKEIEDYIPMSDPYIGTRFKDQTIGHGDLNQMGRDIVYDFMQMHGISRMTVIKS